MQQLGQRLLAAAQPGRRQQTHADVRAQQQPGGLRVGVGEQCGDPFGAGWCGHPGQGGAHLAAAAQHVQADRAQRTGHRAARAAVAGVLARR
ncbi:hypothetical protein SGLAM104S_08247 [Streptomyces glaucescens]